MPKATPKSKPNTRKKPKSKPKPPAAPAAEAADNAVAPDSVRVWRGFRLASLDTPTFLDNLGSIFIPITAILQRLYGLTAYLPTVLPVDRPLGLPDDIALVFYTRPQAHNDTRQTVAGRAYSLLHGAVFDLTQSRSGFPGPLADRLAFDLPYYLFPETVDWQTGFSQVFVGARKNGVQAPAFAAAILDFLKTVKQHRPKGLQGAVVCVSANWVLYWEHWSSEGASLHGRISSLAELADMVLLQPHRATVIDSSLTGHYRGLRVEGGESFNIQLPPAGKSKA